MHRATLFYPVDSYPLDRKFTHWIGLIHWISYPPFEQPAPALQAYEKHGFAYTLKIATVYKSSMYFHAQAMTSLHVRFF